MWVLKDMLDEKLIFKKQCPYYSYHEKCSPTPDIRQ